MISTVNANDVTDVTLGTLTETIPAGFGEFEVKVSFDDNIRPFPEPSFLFAIGGKKRVPIIPTPTVGPTFNLVDTGNREVVMCIGRASDFVYTIKRDPLGTGSYPPSHEKDEVIFQNTMAGSALQSEKQINHFSTKEGQIAYLEELLLVLFGSDTTLIENLWSDYPHFLVSPTSPASKEVTIAPGGYFVRSKVTEGLVKILVVAPGMKVYGRSNLSLEYPPDQRKRRALVYIDDEGGISVFYGDTSTTAEQEPPEINISSIGNVCEPLAELYLDGVVDDKVITQERIRDLRQWADQT